MADGFKPTLLYFLCQRSRCRKPICQIGPKDDEGISEWMCEAGHKNLIDLKYAFGGRVKIIDAVPPPEPIQLVANFPNACTCGMALDRRKISAQVGTYQCGSCGQYWVINTNTGTLEEAMSAG